MWRVRTILSLLREFHFQIAFRMIIGYLLRRVSLRGSEIFGRYKDLFKENIPNTIPSPLISILIPNHNLSKYLAKCLDHILAQTYTQFEILIVNSGCDTENMEIVESLKLSHKDQRIKWYEGPLQGPGANRNFLATKADGSYYFIIDPDDFMERRTLEICLTTALWNCSDVVAPSCYINGDTIKPWILWRDITLAMVLQRNQIPSCCLISRECFELVGGYSDFDNNGIRIHEDWNFLIRMLALNMNLRTIAMPLINISVREGSYSTKPELADLVEQSRLMQELNQDVLNQKQATDLVTHKTQSFLVSPTTKNMGILLDSARASGTTRKAAIAIEIAIRLGFTPIVLVCKPSEVSSQEIFQVETFQLYDLSRSEHWAVWIRQILGSNSIIWNIDTTWIYDAIKDIRRLLPELQFWDTIFLKGHSRTKKALKSKEVDILFSETLELFNTKKITDIGIFMPNHSELEQFEIRSRPDAITSIGILSRLAPEKNISLAIDIGLACQNLINANLNIYVAGSGILEDALKKKYSGNERIIFLGHLDAEKKDEFLRSIDILVSTSYIEGISSSIIEAVTRGTPVAVTSGTPTSKFVEESNVGVIISTDPVRAAGEILTFYSNLMEGSVTLSESVIPLKSDFVDELVRQISDRAFKNL